MCVVNAILLNVDTGLGSWANLIYFTHVWKPDWRLLLDIYIYILEVLDLKFVEFLTKLPIIEALLGEHVFDTLAQFSWCGPIVLKSWRVLVHNMYLLCLLMMKIWWHISLLYSWAEEIKLIWVLWDKEMHWGNILWIDMLQGNGFETFHGGHMESGAKLGDWQGNYNQHRGHDRYRTPILYAKLKNNCCTWPSTYFGAVCPWTNLSEDRKYLFQHEGLLSCGSTCSKFRLWSLTMLIRMP